MTKELGFAIYKSQSTLTEICKSLLAFLGQMCDIEIVNSQKCDL